MTSPAVTIVSLAWNRHRTVFIGAALTLAALAVAVRLLSPLVPPEALIAGSAVPLVGVFGFVFNALLFVEQQGNLSSRYPRFMFTLPARTGVLATWPMLFLTLCSGLMWLATSLLFPLPGGNRLPVVVPALGLAAMMAWAQALAWMPIAIPFVREVFNIASVAALVALAVGLRLFLNISWDALAVLLAGYIASAWAVGWAAVSGDRHGQTWRLWPAQWPLPRAKNVAAHQGKKRPFRSAFEAQVWYEWNVHGLMLNGFVGANLLMVSGVLIGTGRQGSQEWFATIIMILLAVVVAMIGSTGGSFGQLRPLRSQTRGLHTFLPVRPMTALQVVAAKFRMAAASVLLNWAWAVALTALWIFVSGNRGNAAMLFRDLRHRYPGLQLMALIVLASILLPLLSWRMLTGLVTPILAGRRWVANVAAWVYLSIVFGLVGSAHWFSKNPQLIVGVYAALPWLVGGVAILKGALAVAAFQVAIRLRLMTGRDIAAVLSLWLFFSGCAIAMAFLIGPTVAVPVSSSVLAVGFALLVPLVRFPLTTLAFDWNRHR
jgi:hypothetical protein